MTPLKHLVCMVFLLSRSTGSVIPEHHDLGPHLVDLSIYHHSLVSHGPLPSAPLTGSGLIDGAETGPGFFDGGTAIHNGFIGSGLVESGINYPENHIDGGAFGPQISPIGNSPIIEEIQNLANSHGVANHYNIQDEHYHVFRDIPHHVPHPVPVPVPEEVPVPVPQPYPVPVVKNVPVPVVKIQQVPIDKPVPVPVEKIVHVPVVRVVPVPVDHPVPVEKIVEVPVVNVVKVPVHVVKNYPVPRLIKTVHHYGTKHHHGWHSLFGW